MLAELRTLVPDEAAQEEVRQFRERIGVARLDQMWAAAAETADVVERALETGQFERLLLRPSIPRPVALVLLAGVLRCLAASHCEHTWGDRPLVAVLAARVIACDPCLPRYRGALVAQSQRVRAGADQVCDFCLEEQPPGETFRPVLTNYGPVRMFGDMCESCHEATSSSWTSSAA